MVNLDTRRLSSWPLRWHYNVAYQGCTQKMGSHLQVIRSVWEALLQLTMLAFSSLQPCWLAFCPVLLASRLGCRISWYPNSSTIGAGLAHPTFHKQMACFWNLPWSMVISYPRWWCIQLYSPFGHRFLNEYKHCFHFSLFAYSMFTSSFRNCSCYYMVKFVHYIGQVLVLYCGVL